MSNQPAPDKQSNGGKAIVPLSQHTPEATAPLAEFTRLGVPHGFQWGVLLTDPMTNTRIPPNRRSTVANEARSLLRDIAPVMSNEVVSELASALLAPVFERFVPLIHRETGQLPHGFEITSYTQRDQTDHDAKTYPASIGFPLSRAPNTKEEIDSIDGFRTTHLQQLVQTAAELAYRRVVAPLLPEHVRDHQLFGGLKLSGNWNSRYRVVQDHRLATTDPWEGLSKTARIDPYAHAKEINDRVIQPVLKHLDRAMDEFVLGVAIPKMRAEGLDVPSHFNIEVRVDTDPAKRSSQKHATFRVGFRTKPNMPDERLKALDQELMRGHFTSAAFAVVEKFMDERILPELQKLSPDLQRRLLALNSTFNVQIANLTPPVSEG